jgi:phosphate/sulfate permease
MKTALHFSNSSYGSSSTATIDPKNEAHRIYVIKVINQGYRFLLVQAACLVCLAHGSNDVANSITPLLVELKLVRPNNTKFAYWLGGIGISLGLLTLGYKVMETVGKNVIKLDFYKGFACQFATAQCIILGSRLGIPLSTTHCMVGSLFGIVLCNKTSMVKRTYELLNYDKPNMP